MSNQNQPNPYAQPNQNQLNYPSPNYPQNNLSHEPNQANFVPDYSRNQNLINDPSQFGNPQQPFPGAPQATQIPPQPKPKKRGGLKAILIVILVLLLALVGAGGYLFYDYTQQVARAEVIVGSLEDNYAAYENFVDETKESLKELENTDYNIELVEQLSQLDDTLGNDIQTLEQLTKDHEDIEESISDGPNEGTQDFSTQIKEKLAESKTSVEQMALGYQAFKCVNKHVIQIGDLTTEITALSAKYDINVETQEDFDFLMEGIDEMINAMDSYASTLEGFKSCFGETGDLYDEDQAVRELDELKSLFVDLAQGMRDLKTGIQEEDEVKINQAQLDVNDVQVKSNQLDLSEDYYRIFSQKMGSNFDDYYDFVRDSKKELKDSRDELIDQYKARESFLPF